MSGSMVLHKGGREVLFPEIVALPRPQSLGRFHRPVPHFELIEQVRREVGLRGLEINTEKFALAKQDALLFGLFTFKVTLTEDNSREWAMALRSSTDQTFAIEGVAGSHVFVCDNLALSGETFLFHRKHTKGLYLNGVVNKGIEKYLPLQERFDRRVKQLAEAPINEAHAKLAIYDAFTKYKVAANTYFPQVHEAYFEKGEAGKGEGREYPEVTATQWGLHNAFTRVFKDMGSAMVRQESTQKIGRVFGL